MDRAEEYARIAGDARTTAVMAQARLAVAIAEMGEAEGKDMILQTLKYLNDFIDRSDKIVNKLRENQ